MTLTSVVDQALPLGNGPAVIAVDVGGTDTKAALFDESGRMLGLSPRRAAESAWAPPRRW